MKKNVVFWVGVKNEKYSKKYGGWEWIDITRKSWEYWCKKHDVIFFPFEIPVEEDLTKFRINWQKAIFCFDILDEAEIEYDQIYLVDGMNIIKWNTPNIFEMTDRKFTAWRDVDNLGWIYKSIVGYKDFFGGYDFDIQKYFSSGLIVFNEEHKGIFQSFKKLYYNNVDAFVELQDKSVCKGTEQTPLNYHMQMNNVEMNLDLPFTYKLTHIHRKEMFNYNWQLNEDKTPFFIKYGHVWGFSGLPKNQRTQIIKQTWDIVKDNYVSSNKKVKNILDEVSHKDTAKYTTSRKFKEDILKYFSDKKYKEMKVLELGCCQGDGTKIYSEVFGKVYAIDNSQENIDKAKKLCEDKNNIEFLLKDVYKLEWDFPKDVDVVVVDAGHTSQLVSYDIDRCLSNLDLPILIIDDYGNPNQDIKKAINAKVSDKKINIDRFIGEDDGFICVHGLSFDDREGVICTSK